MIYLSKNRDWTFQIWRSHEHWLTMWSVRVWWYQLNLVWRRETNSEKETWSWGRGRKKNWLQEIMFNSRSQTMPLGKTSEIRHKTRAKETGSAVFFPAHSDGGTLQGSLQRRQEALAVTPLICHVARSCLRSIHQKCETAFWAFLWLDTLRLRKGKWEVPAYTLTLLPRASVCTEGWRGAAINAAASQSAEHRVLPSSRPHFYVPQKGP